MRRFVLGTAGHVDHGKTTLVRALTGIDTDRLPEEKRRGITIELGFASWALDAETPVSVIDVPGHRRFVHTMIAGATGIEVILLVVAADEGVMPQTREHLAACEVLGIRRAVVAITKVDRVEPELAVLAGEEASATLAGRFEHEVVLVSAKTGQGLDELRLAIKRALDKTPPRAASPRAHLSVDRAFSVKGAGTVVTGTLVRGELKVGDDLFVVRSTGSVASVARGLHVHDAAATRAEAPTRLAINLAGLALDEVSRGDVVTTDRAVAPTQAFDAALELTGKVRSGATVEVYVGTARSPGRLMLMKTDAAGTAPSEDGTPAVTTRLGRIKLASPLVVMGGDRFVLRGSSSKGPSGAVLGGGRVLDAHPPRGGRRPKRVAALRELEAGSREGAVRALVVEAAPRPLLRDDLGTRFPIERDALARAAEKIADTGAVVRAKSDGWLDRASVLDLAKRARELVAAYHAEHQHDRGIRIETLRQKLGVRAGPLAADEAIRLAARKSDDDATLVLQGDTARLSSFFDGAKRDGPPDKTLSALREAALKGMGEHAITELLVLPPKEVRAVLAKLVRDGAAISAGGQWFDKSSVDALREKVVAHLLTKPGITIAEFKDLSGLGRKQAIPLLEVFDREGVTLRKGDDRERGPRVTERLRERAP